MESTFDVTTDASGQGRFHFQGGNNEIMFSGEGYTGGENAAMRAVERIVELIRDGDVYVTVDGGRYLL